MTNYEIAKAIRNNLEERVNAMGEQLRKVGGNSGPNGLTPDSVKFSPEYRAAKAASSKAFKELQDFNIMFTKQYKNEIREEKRKREQKS